MLMILLFLFVGALIGWLASVLFSRNGLDGTGDMIVGIVGAIGGGFTYSTLQMAPNGLFGVLSMAALGSIFLLILASLIFKPKEQAQ